MNGKTGNYRWTICALVFFATTINYLDRQVISLLKPYLEDTFGWAEKDYAYIVMAFQVAYAIGLIGFGRFIDRIGTKLGYALSLTVWSIAAIAHALAKSTAGFGAARAALGLSEAGNFPAAIKTVAEWFPKKERALATGIFNSGSNIGAIIAPLVVPWIAATWGWQEAFIITGAIGFIWLVFWFLLYEVPARQKRLSQAEFDYIHSDPEEKDEADGKPVSWLKLLGFRQTWTFVIGKFMTDPIWWFLLFWLPSFLKTEYGMTGTQVALPVALVYVITTFGSIGGGWISGFLIRRGKPVYLARKSSMLGFALFVVPVIAAQALGSVSPWLAIIVIGIAAAAHQAWSANLFTTVSDMFPKNAVGSVVGIGGMAGATGSILVSWLTGIILDHYKLLGHIQTGYYILFVVAGLAYVSAWTIMHLLSPGMKKVEL